MHAGSVLFLCVYTPHVLDLIFTSESRCCRRKSHGIASHLNNPHSGAPCRETPRALCHGTYTATAFVSVFRCPSALSGSVWV